MKRPNYESTTAFPECNLSFVEMYKTKTVLNKPIYCGVSILDLSKTLMYDFYYNRLKREYADRVNLLYTDTDSLLLSIRTDDVYDDMKKSSRNYDLSNYDPAHCLYDAKKSESEK